MPKLTPDSSLCAVGWAPCLRVKALAAILPRVRAAGLPNEPHALKGKVDGLQLRCTYALGSTPIHEPLISHRLQFGDQGLAIDSTNLPFNSVNLSLP
jgi:hypothetical protein